MTETDEGERIDEDLADLVEAAGCTEIPEHLSAGRADSENGRRAP